MAEAAGLTGGELDFDLMEGFDFEASDAIFNEESDVVHATNDVVDAPTNAQADVDAPSQDIEADKQDQAVTGDKPLKIYISAMESI